MSKRLTAKVHRKSMNGGGSRAQLIEADDGNLYVVKLIGNPQGTRILANEFVVGRLAELLGAPSPPVTTIDADENFVKGINSTATATFQAGVQFASLYIGGPKMKSVVPSNQELMQRASNLLRLPSLILLNTLVQNEDLKNEHLLISEDASSGEFGFWQVDHGHCLGVTRGWATLGSQSMGTRTLYPQLVTGSDPFCDVFQKLGSLTQSTVQNILDQCPSEQWGISSEEKQSLASYLQTAIRNVKNVIIAAKSTFQNWA